jgi:cytochrome oxidase Cu insertion factor (SCO1/SenC/PrrC family)
MKITFPILFLGGLFALANSQNNPSSNHALAPPIGLEIGQQAPPFALPDQFGHENTKETLRGSKGTVILFFRSADW